MKLTPELAIELAQLRASIKESQKREKEISDWVKEEMEDREIEQYDPKESPFMLCRDEFPKSNVSWKDEWITLAKDKYGKKYKRVMEKISEASKEPQVSLRVEPNPNYQGES